MCSYLFIKVAGNLTAKISLFVLQTEVGQLFLLLSAKNYRSIPSHKISFMGVAVIHPLGSNDFIADC